MSSAGRLAPVQGEPALHGLARTGKTEYTPARLETSMGKRAKADFSLVVVTLIWGSTFVVVKNALADASVFVFLASRMALASLLLAVIFYRRLRATNRQTLLAAAQIGFFLIVGYACQTTGLLYTTPSKSAFITGLSVVLVPLLVAALYGKKINRWTGLGVLVALLGLYFLTIPAGPFRVNRGDLWTLAGACAFAAHIVLIERYSPTMPPAWLTLGQIVTGAILASVLVPAMSLLGLEAPRFTPGASFWLALAITGVFGTALAFSVQVWAQQFTSATHTAIIFSLEPVFAGVTSYIFYVERLGWRATVGAILILTGILLAELKGPVPAAAESAAPLPAEERTE